MLALQNILVAVDFNETSLHALSYAEDLARVCGARLHVLHVLEDAFALPAGSEGTLSAFPQLARQAEDEARARLGALVAGRMPDTTLAVMIGSPAAAIIAHAGRIQAGLIVMGTHGERADPPGEVGSVAARVVGTAECPVLTIRRPPRESFAIAGTAAQEPSQVTDAGLR